MSHNKILQTEILKSCDNKVHNKSDFVAVETPLEIRLGHDKDKFYSLATTMCSPDDIKDFLCGYLYTENIINKAKEIIQVDLFNSEMGLISEIILDKSIDYDKFLNQRHSFVHASCGVCGKTKLDELLTYKYPQIKPVNKDVAPHIIQSLPDKLSDHQQAFAKTGGIHASALFTNDGDLVLAKEDIGRHNALDKLIGAALNNKILPLNDYILLLSGRISFELVHKSLIAGVKHIAAIGAPSTLSIEIAKFNNMSVYGFVKSSGFNQY